MFFMIVIVLLCNCLGEFVEIFETRVYSDSPRIPIRGKGLDQESVENISIVAVLNGFRSQILIRRDYHYSLSRVNANELSMNLLPGKTWANFTASSGLYQARNGARITIREMFFGSKRQNVLQKEYVLANVYMPIKLSLTSPAPEISATKEFLSIRGQGLYHAKQSHFQIELTFEPNLVYKRDYIIVDQSSITLELAPLAKWRQTPGPLVLKSIKGSGGEIEVNATVAIIVDSLG